MSVSLRDINVFSLIRFIKLNCEKDFYGVYQLATFHPPTRLWRGSTAPASVGLRRRHFHAKRVAQCVHGFPFISPFSLMFTFLFSVSILIHLFFSCSGARECLTYIRIYWHYSRRHRLYCHMELEQMKISVNFLDSSSHSGDYEEYNLLKCDVV
jgi:hypothetical protein